LLASSSRILARKSFRSFCLIWFESAKKFDYAVQWEHRNHCMKKRRRIHFSARKAASYIAMGTIEPPLSPNQLQPPSPNSIARTAESEWKQFNASCRVDRSCLPVSASPPQLGWLEKSNSRWFWSLHSFYATKQSLKRARDMHLSDPSVKTSSLDYASNPRSVWTLLDAIALIPMLSLIAATRRTKINFELLLCRGYLVAWRMDIINRLCY
jgi:hypothetical protein